MRRPLLIVLAAAMAVAGGYPSFPSEDSAGTSFFARSVLRVGVPYEVPGFGLAGEDGHPRGFEVALAKVVAEAAGARLRTVQVEPGAEESALRRGLVDLVLLAPVGASRGLAFGPAYYDGGPSLATRLGASVPDRLEGASLCAVERSEAAAWLLRSTPRVQLHIGTDVRDCFGKLTDVRVDGVVAPQLELIEFVAREPRWLTLSPPIAPRGYGPAALPERRDLVAIADGVARLMRADGRWEALHRRWLTPVTGLPPEGSGGGSRW